MEFRDLSVIFFLSFLFFEVSGQTAVSEPILEWGAPTERSVYKKGGRPSQILGKGKDGIYVFRTSNPPSTSSFISKSRHINHENIFLQKLDLNGNHQKYENVTLPNPKAFFQGIFLNKGRLFQTAGFFNKKEEKYFYFFSELNGQSLLPGEWEMFLEVPGNGVAGSSGEFIFSPDSSKIMFCFRPSWAQGPPESKPYVAVFNSEFKKLWEMNVNLPGRKKHFNSASSIVVDNSGNVHMCTKIPKKKTEGEKKFSTSVLISFYEKGTMKKSLPLPGSLGYTLIWSASSDLYCLGFEEKTVDGFFIIKKGPSIDDGLEVTQVSLNNEIFYWFNYGNEQGGKLPDHVVVKPDGGLWLLFEYRDSYTVPATENLPPRTLYKYEDLGILNIDKDGSVKGEEIIKKKMTLDYSSYQSYYPMLVDGNLNISYWFFPNQDPSKKKIDRVTARTGINLITITEDGQKKVKLLDSAENMKLKFQTNSALKLSEREFLFNAGKDKKEYVLKFRFPD